MKPLSLDVDPGGEIPELWLIEQVEADAIAPVDVLALALYLVAFGFEFPSTL